MHLDVLKNRGTKRFKAIWAKFLVLPTSFCAIGPCLFFTSSYAAFLPVALQYLSPSLLISGSLTSVHLSGLRSE